MDLTTLSRVKALLDIADSVTAHDVVLRQIVTSVSAQVERFLDRHVQRKSRTEQYDIEPGQMSIFLRGYPVTGTPSFKEDVNRDFSGSAIDTSNYYVDLRRGIVKFDQFVPSFGVGVFQATYVGGLGDSVARMIGVIGAVTGSITVGNVVEGGTSGARGTVVAVTSGVSITVDVQSGVFSPTETLTDLTASGTCSLTSITTEPIVMSHPDLVQAAEAQVVYNWQRKDMKGVQTLSSDGGAITLETPTIELQPGVRQMLMRHKRMVEAM